MLNLSLFISSEDLILQSETVVIQLLRSELLMMSDLTQPVYLTPEGQPWCFIRVEGEEVSQHEAGREVVRGIRLQYGEFGPAEERLALLSGAGRYNVKMVSQGWGGKKVERLGVWSRADQQSKLFLMTKSGVVTYTRITKVDLLTWLVLLGTNWRVLSGGGGETGERGRRSPLPPHLSHRPPPVRPPRSPAVAHWSSGQWEVHHGPAAGQEPRLGLL